MTDDEGGTGTAGDEDVDATTADGANEPADAPPAATTRNPLMVAAGILAAIALISASVFAYLMVTGNDDADASTPTAATSQLLTALGQADPIGLLELLPAGERDALKGSIPELVNQLDRLHLVAKYDGHRVAGVTITTDSITQQSTPLGPNVTAVDLVAGHLTVQSDGAQLPLTDEGRSVLHDDFSLDPQAGRATRDFAQYPLRLVTVNENGTWRVSIAYSVAENLRTRSGAGAPAIGKGPAPKGSTSPDGAVRELFDAYAAADPLRAAALLLPDEMRAFADYSSLLIPPDPQAVAEANKGKDQRSLPIDQRLGLTHTATVNHLDLAVDGAGSSRRVRITSLDYVIVGEVQREHLVYDGTCLSVDYRFGEATKAYARFTSCTDPSTSTDPDKANVPTDPDRSTSTTTIDPDLVPPTEPGDGEYVDPDLAGPRRPPHDNPFSTIAIFGAKGQLPAFTVVQQSGAWYVSPTRSIVDSVLDTLKVLEPDTVDAFVARVKTLTAPDTSDAAKETTDPDNQLFGPRAVATNRLVAACFVEVMTVVGEESSGDPSIACVKRLVTDNKVRSDAVAPMLLGECYHATPTEPPTSNNPYRSLYLARAATRDCFQKAVDDGLVPDYAVKNHLGKEQGCFAVYDALARTAPETDWEAADVQAKACLDKGLQDNPGKGTPTENP